MYGAYQYYITNYIFNVNSKYLKYLYNGRGFSQQFGMSKAIIRSNDQNQKRKKLQH